MYSNKIARSVCTMDLRLWSWELFSSPSSWGSLNTHQYSWKIAYLYNIFQMYFVIVPVTILRVFACFGRWFFTWKSLTDVKMICRAIRCVSKTIIKLLEIRHWKILVIQCVKTYIKQENDVSSQRDLELPKSQGPILSLWACFGGWFFTSKSSTDPNMRRRAML